MKCLVGEDFEKLLTGHHACIMDYNLTSQTPRGACMGAEGWHELVVELIKVDAVGKPTLDQHANSCWFLAAKDPIEFRGATHSLNEALDTLATKIAKDESQVSQSWGEAPGIQVWETIERAGTVVGLLGVAVFEVVLHSKSGVIFPNRPRRFLVVQRGDTNAIYSCDNANIAFSVAQAIALGEQVTQEGVTFIHKPAVHKLDVG